MAKKKAAAKQEDPKKDASAAAAGIQKRLKKPVIRKTFEPNETEKDVIDYVDRRSEEMIDWRRSLGIEGKWKEADEEYIPHELDFGTTRKRFETDQDTGLRSRMVPVGDVTQQWRSAASAPTLLAKIQTAVGIIIDNQPEGDLVALLKKYQATTDLAYALWKRNWSITNAKENLKLIVFDLFKYGWGAQTTAPRTVKYKKRVLVEADTENPENDKYEEREITWFNDVDRQRLDPFRTWIDELAKPYDPYSMNECYFEYDLSWDAFQVEYGRYPNASYVKPDNAMVRQDDKKKTNRQAPEVQDKKRRDVVTVGIFQSRHKDLFVIWVPKAKIVVYMGPLPNDDGYLSLTHTLLMLRRSDLPYGVSLWEVIRQNKQLYDKMKNMTMDQLVLSIMKFGFHTGTNTALGDGVMSIVPGQSRQVTSSTGNAKDAVNWMEIPGPGADAWKGLEALSSMMDDDSGISPTLEGEVTGKTLGEILHAKESALKRLKTPLENIAWLIEQDAYVSLSWMSQIYAIPTVMQFSSELELTNYERESDMSRSQLFGTQQQDSNGQPQIDEHGQPVIGGPFQAHYLPQLALHLEDSEGNLKTSKESSFFQLGNGSGQITPSKLKWRGIFKVIPRSIVDSSQELVKASKMEVFNMIMPLLQFPPELVARPIAQMLKVVEEDKDDWLPDTFIAYLDGTTEPGQISAPAPGSAAAAAAQGAQGGQPPPPGTPQQNPPGGAPATPPAVPASPGAGAMPSPGMKQGQTIQGATGMTPPQSATVVPGSPMPSIAQLVGGKPGGFFKRGL